MKTELCRLCSHPLGESLLKFPPTPLANEYLDAPAPQDTFPLEICFCDFCGQFQLSETIDPERLFRNYLYEAGHSKANIQHFKQYAIDMVQRFKLQPGDLVVEIASNDGTLLREFKVLGMTVVGIEPALNLAEKANAEGLTTIPDFFTLEVVEKVKEQYGKPKLICANNVLAHTDTLPEIACGIKKLLADDGHLVFEVSYFPDVIKDCLVDLIYLEHSSQHTLLSLISFFKHFQLELFDCQKIANHGGSIRGFVSPISKLRSTRMQQIIWDEINNKFSSPCVLIPFEKEIKKRGEELKKQLKKLKMEGKSIAIFGCPAKATSLFYIFGLDKNDIDFCVDDSKLKIGKFMPGTHLPIFSSEEIYNKKPDVLLILAWNFADAILDKHQKYDGILIIPFPFLKVINAKKNND